MRSAAPKLVTRNRAGKPEATNKDHSWKTHHPTSDLGPDFYVSSASVFHSYQPEIGANADGGRSHTPGTYSHHQGRGLGSDTPGPPTDMPTDRRRRKKRDAEKCGARAERQDSTEDKTDVMGREDFLPNRMGRPFLEDNALETIAKHNGVPQRKYEDQKVKRQRTAFGLFTRPFLSNPREKSPTRHMASVSAADGALGIKGKTLSSPTARIEDVWKPGAPSKNNGPPGDLRYSSPGGEVEHTRRIGGDLGIFGTCLQVECKSGSGDEAAKTEEKFSRASKWRSGTPDLDDDIAIAEKSQIDESDERKKEQSAGTGSKVRKFYFRRERTDIEVTSPAADRHFGREEPSIMQSRRDHKKKEERTKPGKDVDSRMSVKLPRTTSLGEVGGDAAFTARRFDTKSRGDKEESAESGGNDFARKPPQRQFRGPGVEREAKFESFLRRGHAVGAMHQVAHHTADSAARGALFQPAGRREAWRSANRFTGNLWSKHQGEQLDLAPRVEPLLKNLTHDVHSHEIHKYRNPEMNVHFHEIHKSGHPQMNVHSHEIHKSGHPQMNVHSHEILKYGHPQMNVPTHVRHEPETDMTHKVRACQMHSISEDQGSDESRVEQATGTHAKKSVKSQQCAKETLPGQTLGPEAGSSLVRASLTEREGAIKDDCTSFPVEEGAGAELQKTFSATSLAGSQNDPRPVTSAHSKETVPTAEESPATEQTPGAHVTMGFLPDFTDDVSLDGMSISEISVSPASRGGLLPRGRPSEVKRSVLPESVTSPAGAREMSRDSIKRESFATGKAVSIPAGQRRISREVLANSAVRKLSMKTLVYDVTSRAESSAALVVGAFLTAGARRKATTICLQTRRGSPDYRRRMSTASPNLAHISAMTEGSAVKRKVTDIHTETKGEDNEDDMTAEDGEHVQHSIPHHKVRSKDNVSKTTAIKHISIEEVRNMMSTSLGEDQQQQISELEFTVAIDQGRSQDHQVKTFDTGTKSSKDSKTAQNIAHKGRSNQPLKSGQSADSKTSPQWKEWLGKEIDSSTHHTVNEMIKWLQGGHSSSEMPSTWKRFFKNLVLKLPPKLKKDCPYDWWDEVHAVMAARKGGTLDEENATKREQVANNEDWLLGANYLLLSQAHRRDSTYFTSVAPKASPEESNVDDRYSEIPAHASRAKGEPKGTKLTTAASIPERKGDKPHGILKIGQIPSVTDLSKSSSLHELLYRNPPKFLPHISATRIEESRRASKFSSQELLTTFDDPAAAPSETSKHHGRRQRTSDVYKTGSLPNILLRDPEMMGVRNLPKSDSCSELPDHYFADRNFDKILRKWKMRSLLPILRSHIRRMIIRQQKHGQMFFRVLAERSDGIFGPELLRLLGLKKKVELEEDLEKFGLDDQDELDEDLWVDDMDLDESEVEFSARMQQNFKRHSRRQEWKGDEIGHLRRFKNRVAGGVERLSSLDEEELALARPLAPDIGTTGDQETVVEGGPLVEHAAEEGADMDTRMGAGSGQDTVRCEAESVHGGAGSQEDTGRMEAESVHGGDGRQGDTMSVASVTTVTTLLDSDGCPSSSEDAVCSCPDEEGGRSENDETAARESQLKDETSKLRRMASEEHSPMPESISISFGESLRLTGVEEEEEIGSRATASTHETRAHEWPPNKTRRGPAKVSVVEESTKSCGESVLTSTSLWPAERYKPLPPIVIMKRTRSKPRMSGMDVLRKYLLSLREARFTREVQFGKPPRMSRWLQKLEFPYYYMKGEQPPIDPEADAVSCAPAVKLAPKQPKVTPLRKKTSVTANNQVSVVPAAASLEQDVPSQTGEPKPTEIMRHSVVAAPPAGEGPQVELGDNSEPTGCLSGNASNSAAVVLRAVKLSGRLSSWNNNACSRLRDSPSSNDQEFTRTARVVQPLQDVLSLLSRKRRRRRRTTTLKKTPRLSRDSILHSRTSAQIKRKRGKEIALHRPVLSLDMSASSGQWREAVAMTSPYCVFPPVPHSRRGRVTRTRKQTSRSQLEKGLPQIVPRTLHQRGITKVKSMENKGKSTGRDMSKIKCPSRTTKENPEEVHELLPPSPSPLSQWLEWRRARQAGNLPKIGKSTPPSKTVCSTEEAFPLVWSAAADFTTLK